ncbi:YbgC/FadM family acyl-CoA thioesterase [Aquabacterium sp. NJ1]|uniref:YbgC/FadM family acyl-CoA thioesterase n=1 Tax=Aquabacterium sp. NJ1 TaxID=1538295 RepID=UPI0009DDCBB2|nr:YbgC/FadM family acyl-CoA thioesterase [Aquabacterium sp. NJ1]
MSLLSAADASVDTAAAPTVPSALVNAHFRHAIRIYWEDTDAGGIVFYGNYLKFMERARTEWLSSLGFEQEGMRHSGEGMFVVADTQMRFIKPARLDDRLTVTVSVINVGRSSVSFAQDVWRGATLLTQGQVRIGWVQSQPGQEDLKPGRIPARILSVLPTPIPTSGA